MEANNTMNPFESFLVEMLQGKIVYEDGIVEVRREFQPPMDNLPCITLDTNISDNTVDYRRSLVGGESLIFHRVANININLWCNTEDERENISEQIRKLYTRLLNHDYIFCTQFVDGRCASIKRVCPASTMGDNARALKRQCPLPEVYGYEWLAKKHGIFNGTLIIEPPFTMDENENNPPLLRNVFEASCEYMEVMSKTGTPSEEIEFL